MKDTFILLVFFGTTKIEIINKNLKGLQREVENRFSDCDVDICFTSSILVKKLEEKNVFIKHLDQSIVEVVEKGYKNIIIQPLHIIPGKEYNKILKAVDLIREEFSFQNKLDDFFPNIKVSTPLLYEELDYKIVIDILSKKIEENTSGDRVLIFMGHGTTHKADIYYRRLNNELGKKYKNVFITTYESGVSSVSDILKRLSIRKVTLASFFLISGKHVNLDMINGEKSWKNELVRLGYEVDTIKEGLIEDKDIREIFIEKLVKYV